MVASASVRERSLGHPQGCPARVGGAGVSVCGTRKAGQGRGARKRACRGETAPALTAAASGSECFCLFLFACLPLQPMQVIECALGMCCR